MTTHEMQYCARCRSRLMYEHGNWWCTNPDCEPCPTCGEFHAEDKEFECGDCDFVGTCAAYQQHRDVCPAWRIEETKS